jgi:hypothetical protein
MKEFSKDDPIIQCTALPGGGTRIRIASNKRADASRRNGRASQGPRSSAGKARSARNATRHGLNTPPASDPKLAPEITALAQRIAGHGAHVELFALALQIAEAQCDLCRIRQARQRVFAEVFTDGAAGDAAASTGNGVPMKSLVAYAQVMANCGKELAVLERYERRALSRRKSAIRAFDRARTIAQPVAAAASDLAWLRFGETNPSPSPQNGGPNPSRPSRRIGERAAPHRLAKRTRAGGARPVGGMNLNALMPRSILAQRIRPATRQTGTRSG